MECRKMKPVLALVLLLSCHLLLPLVSSVPVSRSVSLANHQASASSLTPEALPVQGVVTTAAEEQSVVGEVVARMDIEINDYPGSSANGRHEPPRSPGRG
ncbi:hypothetical protein TRIUR3_23418 [Triticum urartu]|uniref:Uncharacterized protein n=1 Tax=Triticum urartu TaxID=4572 RepID=M7ZA23_TRIUA|nr:uncharacterized protein LOC125548741 [Triticum urartu]EMS56476.1 hypothetical protein TRIUR3_23418 [Triticum urartu]